ncbi:hypothetical protein AOXY_G30471 [Acipenser oxyrinchus oxyrinchus]|uniref:CA216 protein n=1 Tax=Acipenser oxyrinchus oxyrinchus TaxID=40147 RepID=A0AAD8FTX3_ACIOX|nr:hypothetical protein AOXY_G30471 [Acipenser oxyrinchus oxyrinchus]
MFSAPSPAEMDRGTVSSLCLSNQNDRKCMQQDSNFNFLDGEGGEPSLLPRSSSPPDSNENLNQTRTRQSPPLLLRASLLRASLPAVPEAGEDCIWGRVFRGAHKAQLPSPVSVEPGQGRGDLEPDWDPAAELPGLLGAVRTLQQEECFKAQEKQRHQVQLTMYRRLALIRWLRSLQQSVSEQQGRLQDSYDIILQNRKELLTAAGRGRR